MAEIETIEVHESIFYFRHTNDTPVYSLFALRHATIPVMYPACVVQRSAQAVMHLFNKLYCAKCNCMSVALVFCRNGHQVVYKPNQHGLLAVDSVIANTPEPVTTQEQLQALHTSDLAISIHTMVFDYIQTRNGHFNIGVSLLPCGTISIPTSITDASISQWLRDWTLCVEHSATCAICVLRDSEGAQVQVAKVGTTATPKVLERNLRPEDVPHASPEVASA